MILNNVLEECVNMERKKLSKSLTDNRFGGWGWSMIFYTMILYFFYAAITTDGMNLIPSAFAEAHGWDANTLLSVATPAGLVGLVGGFTILYTALLAYAQ